MFIVIKKTWVSRIDDILDEFVVIDVLLDLFEAF